ncbi:unnamed protein product [Vitrella brassicaformis CCMP3155]|uniref:At4g15545-like C-terminal domain-containing protein n=1 Tax=Vitrella brassicaformis (strain CCMP3155) TaxID=1169540 RepID=A0A0G4EAJ9_VITBC|nr:unnamed protein product [Vitrella brassicaformis CCMP3155]|eukprot:CEL92652.1 unnamed protein product [Vitrella brassicaformis CCMP3155]
MAAQNRDVMNMLPADPEEQLALGFRIISNAYKSRVQNLDNELRNLKGLVDEKAGAISALQKKNSMLEVELLETRQRCDAMTEENKHLVATIKKLHRDIQRLESLRKAVLTSLQDDNTIQTEAILSKEYYGEDHHLDMAAPLTMSEMRGGGEGTRVEMSKSSPAQPGAQLRTEGAGGDFLGAATGGGSLVDGKQFFRDARARMTYEHFNQFLTAIKRLNNHTQTREETLATAEQLFGESNKDLFDQFTKLLNRHG